MEYAGVGPTSNNSWEDPLFYNAVEKDQTSGPCNRGQSVPARHTDTYKLCQRHSLESVNVVKCVHAWFQSHLTTRNLTTADLQFREYYLSNRAQLCEKCFCRSTDMKITLHNNLIQLYLLKVNMIQEYNICFQEKISYIASACHKGAKCQCLHTSRQLQHLMPAPVFLRRLQVLTVKAVLIPVQNGLIKIPPKCVNPTTDLLISRQVH